jgi:hypothetical protein
MGFVEVIGTRENSKLMRLYHRKPTGVWLEDGLRTRRIECNGIKGSSDVYK